MISAMLTAVKDFVHDSFEEADGAELDTVELGEFNVWIQHGPKASLCAVVTGTPPRELRNVLQRTLEELHSQFAPVLARYDGDTESTSAMRPLVQTCLVGQQPLQGKPARFPRVAVGSLARDGSAVRPMCELAGAAAQMESGYSKFASRAGYCFDFRRENLAWLSLDRPSRSDGCRSSRDHAPDRRRSGKSQRALGAVFFAGPKIRYPKAYSGRETAHRRAVDLVSVEFLSTRSGTIATSGRHRRQPA